MHLMTLHVFTDQGDLLGFSQFVLSTCVRDLIWF